MENGQIKDSQLKATSSLNGLTAPIYARLNLNDGQGGWCPDQSVPGNKTGPFYTQYIQIKLDAPVRIKGIAIQGRANGPQKVKRYWVNYTPNQKDSRSWKWVYEGPGQVKVTDHISVWLCDCKFSDTCTLVYGRFSQSLSSLLSKSKKNLSVSLYIVFCWICSCCGILFDIMTKLMGCLFEMSSGR